MSLPDRTTVLIVGAGPAGLAAALSLLHNGFQDFIIVDALAQGQNVSRAVVIHAATLEALDTVGCGDEIVSKGVEYTSFNAGTRSNSTLLSPHFESLKAHTRHPYILMVTQNVTERMLEEKLGSLGVVVHRPIKVVGLKRNAIDPQITDVTFEDGRVLMAKYVIGADGARSVVRTIAGIGFSDPSLSDDEADNNLAQMVLADVTFDNRNPNNFVQSATLSANNLFLCFPLPSSYNDSLATAGAPIFEQVYRIACGVPSEEGDAPHSLSKEFMQMLVDRFGPYRLVSNPSLNPNTKPTCIKDVIWSSRFRTRAALADTSFTRLGSGESGEGGAILLIGDASHIHSPAGGQGMNLGLRDAIFLGEALAKHIRATESQLVSEADQILRKYAAARHARALEVINLTKGILSITGMKYRQRFAWWCPFDSATVRDWGLWILGSLPFVQRRIAYQLSGLARR